MAHDGGGAAPWLQPPQFHYRLGISMRQHVRGGSRTVPRSSTPLAFWPRVVTSKLTQSQECKQGKRYSFVMRLLQICANVKSALVRQSKRAGECKRRRRLDNPFYFNILQGYSFLIRWHVQRNAGAELQERAAVSTTFSTEGRVYARRGNALPEEPQVRKNRGFPRFYFTVTTSRTTSHRSDGPRAAKEPDREHKDRADESENAVDGDSHQAERQRQQPDERIKHQSQQRERPAQDEQDDPQKESSHDNLVCGGHKAVGANGDRTAAGLYSILRESARKGSSTAYSLSRRRLAMEAGTSASSCMCESSISVWRTRPSA